MTLLQTPLFQAHKDRGAKLIDFSGFMLPVYFTSIKEEHEAVRTKTGIFDVSHMGELIVSGTNSTAFLQHVLTNDVSTLYEGKAQYTFLCNESGGVIDDLLVYKLDATRYLLVVNAGNIKTDLHWLQRHAFEHVVIENVSDDLALLAVQGPNATDIVSRTFQQDVATVRPFHFVSIMNEDGKEILISRTGYTGEDGFEIYCLQEDATMLWERLLEVGGENIFPCGLGARDTLRFEACLPLHGQELTPMVTPFEAGFHFAVKLQKEYFIGKEALKREHEKGVQRKIVGLEVVGRGIPRTGYDVYVGDKKIGVVTSGTQLPLTKRNVGLALLESDYTTIGTNVDIIIRDKRVESKVVATPFYKRNSK